jgi:hypothetical protein
MFCLGDGDGPTRRKLPHRSLGIVPRIHLAGTPSAEVILLGESGAQFPERKGF